MRKTSFIFAGIMSAVIGTAYATGENVVASKSYVDTKQVKLHAANAEPANNGTTVVTYTDTEGTTGERGIFDWDTGWDEHDNGLAEEHEGDLVTVLDAQRLASAAIDNYERHIEPVRVVKTTCANAPACTLWEMQDVIVHKIRGSDDWECMEATDCPACSHGARPVCTGDKTCGCSGIK